MIYVATNLHQLMKLRLIGRTSFQKLLEPRLSQRPTIAPYRIVLGHVKDMQSSGYRVLAYDRLADLMKLELHQVPPDGKEVLDTFRVAAEVGSNSLGAYVSDVLAVELLQKDVHLAIFGELGRPCHGGTLRVVALFETMKDLRKAGSVLRKLLSIDWYRDTSSRTTMGIRRASDIDSFGKAKIVGIDDELDELDGLAISEPAKALKLDQRLVDEEIFAAVVGSDESKALLLIEPFHHPLNPQSVTLCHWI
ncbi:phosphoenolpyruvate carboxylase 4 [Actinidia rufa]|uniref:Phosphoenolpyruvate carboxylase 4 n=1 Tax=Actinidia rufa TaxID=165716 RepID=A0A7J0H5S2_9ERIC|nr:phosphoenolpyruvate carboxylase 4 [Actinidia rufa]